MLPIQLHELGARAWPHLPTFLPPSPPPPAAAVTPPWENVYTRPRSPHPVGTNTLNDSAIFLKSASLPAHPLCGTCATIVYSLPPNSANTATLCLYHLSVLMVYSKV